MPPTTADVLWQHQREWNQKAEARDQALEDRVSALERRRHFVAGFAAAIGSIAGSSIVASVVGYLLLR